MGAAADQWRAQLEAWAIPPELLEAVDESPYVWPVKLWERRRRLAETQPEPFTLEVIRGALPDRGEVIDVGAGTGRASLPLAREGHRLVAVEKDPGMAAALEEAAAGLDVEVICGEWPAAAEGLGDADVVMAAHVVYDCQDLVPFLATMANRARRTVVLELTETHPWSDLAPLYRELHGLDRPEGPTVDDLVAVLEESFGVHPHVARWSRPSVMWYESWDELLEFVGRRVVLPRERWDELRPLLEPEIVSEDGRLRADRQNIAVTVWWEP